MDIKEIFAANLRRHRRTRRLSQEALADAAGIDRTYVSALERGIYSASLTTVEDIARALGLQAFELLVPNAASE